MFKEGIMKKKYYYFGIIEDTNNVVKIVPYIV